MQLQFKIQNYCQIHEKKLSSVWVLVQGSFFSRLDLTHGPRSVLLDGNTLKRFCEELIMTTLICKIQ